jgi:hypothetical protein
MKRRASSIIPAACLAMAMAAGAQGGDSTIYGMVSYREGGPANARIYYARLGKYRQTTSRFKAGQNIGYEIRNLLPGRYELVVQAPGARPQRIWGISLMSFDKKLVNVTVDRCSPEQELFWQERGQIRITDLPHDWEGGWLLGSLLAADGLPHAPRLLRIAHAAAGHVGPAVRAHRHGEAEADPGGEGGGGAEGAHRATHDPRAGWGGDGSTGARTHAGAPGAAAEVGPREREAPSCRAANS